MTQQLGPHAILLGIGLVVFLGAICPLIAVRLGVPALLVLLPVGFAVGVLTRDVDPTLLLGPGFDPVVSLGVAVILFRGGRDLDFSMMSGPDGAVVRTLLIVGVPLTWAIATGAAMLTLGLPFETALLLGSMLVVSGPTVVGPLLEFVRPNGRLNRILIWEGILIDPVGAVLALVVFHAITVNAHTEPVLYGVLEFSSRVAIGLAGGAVGSAILWIVYRGPYTSAMKAAATFGTVVLVAALCNVLRKDSGLVAAVIMGMAVTNIKAIPADRRTPFFDPVVTLVIGVLFISVPATIKPEQVTLVLAGTVALTAILVLFQRPLVAWISTASRSMETRERLFVGAIAPRGIVAAATAAVLSPQLAAAHVPDGGKVLPATFLVVALTALVYSLIALPAGRSLGVLETADEPVPQVPVA